MDYELMMNGNVKIGTYAPDFEAETTMGSIKLSDYRGKWVVLFSHPGDFTPVCTTEIIAFEQFRKNFENLNTCLIGLSVDSNPSHLAWLYNIYMKTGIKVQFPIIADRNGKIARKYGMISNEINLAETIRDVFIIDPEGVVKLILTYPMNVGRCIPEILRCIQALQTSEMSNVLIPANWIPYEPVIIPMPKTFEELLKRIEDIMENKNGMSWYLSFKNPVKNENNKKIEENDEL